MVGDPKLGNEDGQLLRPRRPKARGRRSQGREFKIVVSGRTGAGASISAAGSCLVSGLRTWCDAPGSSRSAAELTRAAQHGGGGDLMKRGVPSRVTVLEEVS